MKNRQRSISVGVVHLCWTVDKWGSTALTLFLTWYQLPPSELAHTRHDLENRLKFGDLEPSLAHPCLLLPWLINHVDFNQLGHKASCAYVLYFLFITTSEHITFDSCYLKPYNANVLIQSITNQHICVILCL